MSGIELDLNGISDSPEDLMATFAALEAGDDVTLAPNKDENEVKPTENQDESGQQAEEAAQATAAEEQREPEGVATKDGKHVIPYSVLKSERERANRAEQLAKEAREQLEALKSQQQEASQGVKTGEPTRTDAQIPDASDLSPEDLEALKEDFPTVYKAVMASMAAANAIKAKLAPVEESVRSQEQAQARTAAEAVQDAIDAVPKLAHIQANDPEAFEMAKSIDASLRTRAAWADKPLAERFAKVAEMVEAAMGPISIPGQAKPATQNVVDLKSAAKAKAQAAAKAPVPTSLSEFPVGQHAAQDEQEALESMTSTQLATKFASMTPDQMDAYFSNL